MEIEITSRRGLVLLLAALSILGLILLIGHLYPQTIDNFGDRVFGPFFYGKQPS